MGVTVSVAVCIQHFNKVTKFLTYCFNVVILGQILEDCLNQGICNVIECNIENQITVRNRHFKLALI